MDEHTKQIIDWGNFGAIAAVLIGWIPDATIVLSFVWLVIRIWETDTVQKFLRKKK